MNTFKLFCILFASALPCLAQPNLSYKQEIQRSIDKGTAWLKANQHADGYWLSPDHPAVTALCLLSYHGDPSLSPKAPLPDWVKRAHAFLLKNVQPDGGIYVKEKGLANYNTALCMMALFTANDPANEKTIRKARSFLVGLQQDFDTKGVLDSPLDGGIGYGNRYPHSDLNNTLTALESLYFTRHLVKDNPKEPDLNWAAAIQFIQNCQNLPSHNKLPFATDDPKQKGGFIYFPGHSMAGSATNSATGKVALRSYGSISYAGMMSYIYAEVKRDDPRVEAVHKWLTENFSLEENPGMGPQGLYYYYYLMAKALSVHGTTEIQLKNGKTINWRKDLSAKLLNLQKSNGS
ncbi:MAG: cycloartenol synthase, partial [Pedosphaera sp.]|nr:cycloartenol synthase [Pedosphaera sp.]